MSKTLQGYHTKLDKTNKRTEAPTVSSRGRQQCYTVQYNHDRLIIVKRRPKKYSLQLSTERRQRQCILDRRRQAVPLGRHDHRALNV